MNDIIPCDTALNNHESRRRFREALFLFPSHQPDADAQDAWAVVEIRYSGSKYQLTIAGVHLTEEDADRQMAEIRSAHMDIVNRYEGLPMPPVEAFGYSVPYWWFRDRLAIHGFYVFKKKTSIAGAGQFASSLS